MCVLHSDARNVRCRVDPFGDARDGENILAFQGPQVDLQCTVPDHQWVQGGLRMPVSGMLGGVCVQQSWDLVQGSLMDG